MSAQNIPMLIARSANWRGDVVAIITLSKLSKDTIFFITKPEERTPIAKNTIAIIVEE